jgi:hypothetical protein
MDPTTQIEPNPASSNGSGGAADKVSAVAETAQTKAGEVASTVTDQAAEVGGAVKEQAGVVAQDAKAHATQLLSTSKDELRSQANAQAAKVAEGLRSLSGELGTMASAASDPSPLSDVTRDVGERIGAFAERLDNDGLDVVMGDVRSIARRHPGSFLLGALASGFLAGRMLKTVQEVVSEPDAAPALTPADSGVAQPSSAGEQLPSVPTPLPDLGAPSAPEPWTAAAGVTGLGTD